MLEEGMLVRILPTYGINAQGERYECRYIGEITRILKYLGYFAGYEGIERHWWQLEIHPINKFHSDELEPYNPPGNEAFGSWDDMMESLDKVEEEA